MEQNYRELLKNRKRIVVKIGSSSLAHPETQTTDFIKMERLVRELVDLKNSGKEVVLVTSGAISVGVKALGLPGKPDEIARKQACAAVGQARLMVMYQKLFGEYNQVAAQILMDKNTMMNDLSRENALNTFRELLKMGVIPVVNENDTISTYEMRFGDNDTLSAVVSALIGADLLILLSDIDGLYSDDPNQNPDAKFIDFVESVDERFMNMGKKTSGSSVGTGGMHTKLLAARIANSAGADMVITNGNDVTNIHKIVEGRNHGTLFAASKNPDFNIKDYFDEDK